MVIALLALLGSLLALYLTLYKLGIIGQLVCQMGSCETVNTSRWSTFLGLPVAAWGFLTYAVLLGLALFGLQESHSGSIHGTGGHLRVERAVQQLAHLSGAVRHSRDLYVLRDECFPDGDDLRHQSGGPAHGARGRVRRKCHILFQERLTWRRIHRYMAGQ
jgi:hypothetical protein